MTEDEAKTKRCHQTLYGAQSIEDGSEGTAGTNCIGSACMAWRWVNPPEYHKKAAGWMLGDGGPAPEGHCGLAGKP